MSMERKKAPLTPELEEWRKLSPIGQWIAKGDSNPTFNARARRRRLRLEMGVERVMLYYWINGQVLPRTEKFVKICAMIGVSQKTYLRWYNSFPFGSESGQCGVQPAASV